MVQKFIKKSMKGLTEREAKDNEMIMALETEFERNEDEFVGSMVLQ